ncbi:hypothetical protein [Sporocytophaga myxococcoides]|uniref:hypothetical protein n=1 Tax=Sporocytophaga myxococcoides TaxID=153721 RepID=UPI0012E00E2D|nr:hypothetical protein [Sporocytophaga myxococcoides]
MDTLEVNGKILKDVYAFDENTVSNISIHMGIHKRYYKHGIGLVRFETTKKSKKYDRIF